MVVDPVVDEGFQPRNDEHDSDREPEGGRQGGREGGMAE